MKPKKIQKNDLIIMPAKFAESGVPSEIQILIVGEWDHPVYGPFRITTFDVTEFKMNFDRKVRKGVPITAGHEVMDEKKAIGWFTEIIDKGQDGLWGKVEWTPEGKTLLQQKSFKYFSPEFFTLYEDPETHEEFRNVLVGGALTNKPYFKQLEAIVMSDLGIIKKFNDTNMDLEQVRAKAVEELTDEDKQLLRDNKDTLSAEDMEKFGSVFEDEQAPADDKPADDKPADDQPADDKPADAPADDAPADDKPADGEQLDASETVQISAAELAILRTQANKGAKAFEENRRMQIDKEAGALIFNESTGRGFSPASKEKVFSFMLTLSKTQRKLFSELVAALPKANIFGEIGDGGDTNTDADNAGAKLQKMASEVSEKEKLSFSDALAKIVRENPELAKKHEQEMAKKARK